MSFRKSVLVLSAALVLTIFGVIGSPQAQAVAVLYSFDELGNGRVSLDGAAATPLIAGPMLDPGPGGHSTLRYIIGLFPTPGDVRIFDAQGVLSDVLRFSTNAAIGNNGIVFFYSDILDGADAPADTGPPTAFNTNVVNLTEVGNEGANGVVYTPTAGQPGFSTISGFVSTFNVISDGRLPEPGSLALLGLGLAAFGITRRRKPA
jgi:hypothetical protein